MEDHVRADEMRRDAEVDHSLEPLQDRILKTPRPRLINELAAQLRPKIEDEIQLHVGENNRQVLAKWKDIEGSAPVSSTFYDVRAINNAANSAMDKLCRQLAEVYISIAEKLK